MPPSPAEQQLIDFIGSDGKTLAQLEEEFGPSYIATLVSLTANGYAELPPPRTMDPGRLEVATCRLTDIGAELLTP